MAYLAVAAALLAISVYINLRRASEEAQRHEYDRLRNTRPPDKN